MKLTWGQVNHSVVGLRLASRTDSSVEMFLEDLRLVNTQKNRQALPTLCLDSQE